MTDNTLEPEICSSPVMTGKFLLLHVQLPKRTRMTNLEDTHKRAIGREPHAKTGALLRASCCKSWTCVIDRGEHANHAESTQRYQEATA